MIVTALEPREGTLIAVFIEGEFALTLDAEVLARAHIRLGSTVDRTALEQLRVDGELRRARERALYLLGGRSYTRKELRDKLTAHYDPALADQTADRMVELGLVDDAAYALRYARSRAQSKRFGPARIRQELLQKGIDRALADQALSELADECDLDETLLTLIRCKYARSLGDPKAIQRTVAALQRAGYAYGQIRQALEAFEADPPPEWEE